TNSATTASTITSNIIAGSNCITNQPNTTFSSTIATSSNTIKVNGNGTRIDKGSFHHDANVTFSFTSDVNIEITGFLLRAMPTADGGVNGYGINFVSNGTSQYVQVIYFNNGLIPSQNNWGTYLDGWVVPVTSIKGVTFHISMYGDTVNISADGVGKCHSINLASYTEQPVWESGYFGVMNWVQSGEVNMTYSHISFDGNLAKEVTEALINSTNCSSFASELITDGGNGEINAKNYAWSVYNGIDAADFTINIDTEYVATGVSNFGFLFRTQANPTNGGMDGYYINFVANDNQQYFQVVYLQNCCNSNGTEYIYDYIGGWVFADSTQASDGSAKNTPIMGRVLTVTVIGDTLSVTTAGREVCSFSLTGSQVSKNYTVYAHGGFGVCPWQDGIDLNLMFKEIVLL
ncbi:MAG: hypothetical protein IJW47_00900, partial [Clostridia bacterium]|nr:hypothetical protein [Clostridia bacterium]